MASSAESAKRRGRPPVVPGLEGTPRREREMMTALYRLDPSLMLDVCARLDDGTIRRTVVLALARYHPDRQREALAYLDTLSARAAKRLTVSRRRESPTVRHMAERLARWAVQEWPTATSAELREACRIAAFLVQRDGSST